MLFFFRNSRPPLKPAHLQVGWECIGEREPKLKSSKICFFFCSTFWASSERANQNTPSLCPIYPIKVRERERDSVYCAELSSLIYDSHSKITWSQLKKVFFCNSVVSSHSTQRNSSCMCVSLDEEFFCHFNFWSNIIYLHPHFSKLFQWFNLFTQ